MKRQTNTIKITMDSKRVIRIPKHNLIAFLTKHNLKIRSFTMHNLKLENKATGQIMGEIEL